MNAAPKRSKRVVTLILPWPPQVNHLYAVANIRSHKTGKSSPRKFLSKKAVQYYEAATKEAQAQGKAGRRLGGSLRLILVLHAPTKAAYDVDNRCKALCDALTKAGVIDDDSSVDSLVVERGMPVKGGMVVVTVEER